MLLSREAARALETGRWSGLASRVLASALAPAFDRGLVRPAFVPSDIALVCVGGATIGGSGKTRIAIACARELASRGMRVVLVGHAYHAAPHAARVVAVDDALEAVGDEALVCARALEPSKVPVVIGPTRQAAIDHAVSLVPAPEVLVLDGPLAVRGRRGPRSVSLLAVDANRPWGSGRLPPAGDLRASRETLLAHADHVVPVDATPLRVRWTNVAPSGEPSWLQRSTRDGTAEIASLRTLKLGLFTAIARPDRLVRALDAVGVRPRETLSINDHGPLGAARSRLAGAQVDAWVATEKCALHLDGVSLGCPLGILEGDVLISPGIFRGLIALSLPAPSTAPTTEALPK